MTLDAIERHMIAGPASPMFCMDRVELERELERGHAECWRWALACVGRDRDMAQDVLQSAYVRVLSGAAARHGGSSFKTWVFGVIRLTALEELRQRRARIGNADCGELVDPTPLPDVLTERAERAAALVRAIAGLSPRQREVLHLVFYHDLTIKQAADVLKISLGSARTHYERGKKMLASLLAPVEEDVG
jgi:RNA polymerase sigma-70 factor (ECF subfamily)